jgi:hypothetical protein
VNTFPESDWKKLRAIREEALARFCRGALRDLKAMLDSADREANPHATYLAVYKHVHAQDDRLSELFDDWRRSTAIFTLMRWAGAGILTRREFESLSEGTRAVVQELMEVRFLDEPSD